MAKITKNIQLSAIPADFSELGGYNAHFIGDQNVKDAKDFTAEVIDELGIVADGAVLATGFERFMSAVLGHAATTGQPVRFDGVMRVGPLIRGLYKSKSSKVPLKNVRLGITPLKAMKPTVEILLHNVTEGEMIRLEGVTSDVKTIWFAFPEGALGDAKSVKVTVKSRCGDPEAGLQTKSITAKIG